MAAKGDRRAIERLTPPEYPEELEYLRTWLMELHGRSGAGMSGLMPLSYQTIESWARLKELAVLPHEVEALIVLDSVYLHPGKS